MKQRVNNIPSIIDDQKNKYITKGQSFLRWCLRNFDVSRTLKRSFGTPLGISFNSFYPLVSSFSFLFRVFDMDHPHVLVNLALVGVFFTLMPSAGGDISWTPILPTQPSEYKSKLTRSEIHRRINVELRILT